MEKCEVEREKLVVAFVGIWVSGLDILDLTVSYGYGAGRLRFNVNCLKEDVAFGYKYVMSFKSNNVGCVFPVEMHLHFGTEHLDEEIIVFLM